MLISDWSSDVCSSDLRAGRGVDVERLLDLAADVAEAAGLVAVARRLGVAVHRVADPQYAAAVAPDRVEQRRQPVRDVRGAHAVDQAQPAGLVVGVEHVDQRQQLVWRHRRPDLHRDRIADAAEVFDVRTVERGGAHRSEEHTSELQSLMRTSYAVFCLKKKNTQLTHMDTRPRISSDKR